MTRAERVEEALGLLRDAMLADVDDEAPEPSELDEVADRIEAAATEAVEAARDVARSADSLKQTAANFSNKLGSVGRKADVTFAAIEKTEPLMFQKVLDLDGVCQRLATIADRLESLTFKGKATTP